jgi:hypothetical protein
VLVYDHLEPFELGVVIEVFGVARPEVAKLDNSSDRREIRATGALTRAGEARGAVRRVPSRDPNADTHDRLT